MQSLDELGILAATNKSSIGVDYLRHYDEFLQPYKDMDDVLLEIGVAEGASLRLWENFFTRAKIVGVDINDKAKQFATARSSIEIGSQDNAEFLTLLANKYKPKIIIDDGSHRADHVVFTFEHLFPQMPYGGLYIIEDLHVHFGQGAPRWRGNATITPQRYLQDLIPRIISSINTRKTESISGQIDRVCIFPGVALFWKKSNEIRVNYNTIDRLNSLVSQSDNPKNLMLLAGSIAKKGGSLEKAKEFAQRAVDLDPTRLSSIITLSNILCMSGDEDGAISTLEQAAKITTSARDLELLGRKIRAVSQRKERKSREKTEEKIEAH